MSEETDYEKNYEPPMTAAGRMVEFLDTMKKRADLAKEQRLQEEDEFVRGHERRRYQKFDEEAQVRFLRTYIITGQLHASARAAGVSEECVRLYNVHNRDGFRDRYEEARGLYKDMLEEAVRRRAVEGWQEPLIGGENHDEIVGYVTKYSDRLLEFLTKRHIPEFRDKQQIDLNVTGGVMVVPSQPKTVDSWAEEYGSLERPTEDAQILPPTKE